MLQIHLPPRDRSTFGYYPGLPPESAWMPRSRPRALKARIAFVVSSLLLAAACVAARAAGPVTLTEPERKEALAKLKAYLDPESPNSTVARTDFMARLRAFRTGQPPKDVLSDIDLLQELIYVSRPFDKPLDRKNLPKEEWEVRADGATGIVTVRSTASEAFKASYLLPTRYPTDPKKVPATAPFPMIVTLHDLEDTRAKEGPNFAGETAIKRRYPKAASKAILDDWIVFAPTAPRAEFAKEGKIESERVNLTRMWKSYQVDYDRFVLDGGNDALTWASSQPVWYAGVIVRGDQADIAPALVKNCAHLQVYVVGTENSAAKKSLLAGGMKPDHIKVGPEAGIAAWLNAKDATGKAVVRRTTPLAFEWIVQDRPAHRLAHWVNISDLDPAVDVPSMKVEVLDTAEDPNTIRITSTGIITVNLFLNDRIVCLDRPVRVVTNGEEVKEGAIVTSKPDPKLIKLPSEIERNADVLFDTNPTLSIKKSFYFGWLFPVNLTVKILGDASTAEKKPAPIGTPTPKEGTPEEEEWAKQYFEKAMENVKEGEFERAKRNLRKAIDVGQTTWKEKAEAELKKLEGG